MNENALIINSTDLLGNKLQRTVTCTNDGAARDKMLTLAQGINALSTNTLVEAKRVEKVDLDEDPDGGYKPGAGFDVINLPDDTPADEGKNNPTITLSSSVVAKNTMNSYFSEVGYYDAATITYDGDGVLYIEPYSFSGGVNVTARPTCKIIDDNGTKKLRFFSFLHKAVNNGVVYNIRSTATDSCNTATATFTVQ